jgi:hypothetical protein
MIGNQRGSFIDTGDQRPSKHRTKANAFQSDTNYSEISLILLQEVNRLEQWQNELNAFHAKLEEQRVYINNSSNDLEKRKAELNKEIQNKEDLILEKEENANKLLAFIEKEKVNIEKNKSDISVKQEILDKFKESLESKNYDLMIKKKELDQLQEKLILQELEIKNKFEIITKKEDEMNKNKIYKFISYFSSLF